MRTAAVVGLSVALSLVRSPAVSAGTTYRFQITTDGTWHSKASGRVWVDGGSVRREYDPGGQPADDWVYIRRAGEPGSIVLDTQRRTFQRLPERQTGGAGASPR